MAHIYAQGQKDFIGPVMETRFLHRFGIQPSARRRPAAREQVPMRTCEKFVVVTRGWW